MSCVVLKTLGLKHTLSCEGTGERCHCSMTLARQCNGLSGEGRASASLGNLKSPFPLGKSVSRDLSESWGSRGRHTQGVWPCCAQTGCSLSGRNMVRGRGPLTAVFRLTTAVLWISAVSQS